MLVITGNSQLLRAKDNLQKGSKHEEAEKLVLIERVRLKYDNNFNLVKTVAKATLQSDLWVHINRPGNAGRILVLKENFQIY